MAPIERSLAGVTPDAYHLPLNQSQTLPHPGIEDPLLDVSSTSLTSLDLVLTIYPRKN